MYFTKIKTIHTGESMTELLLCLFWCDDLFLRRVAGQRHNSRVVWKRPALLRRSIHRHASESTSKFGTRREMTMVPFVRRSTILWHLIRATSVTCRQHDVRAARHGSPGVFKKPRGDSFRVRERHPTRLEFQYVPSTIAFRESSGILGTRTCCIVCEILR